MSGLVAPVGGIDAGEERAQVVPVHRIVEALNNLRWLRFHLRAHR
jgi:hypothetical protein